MVVIAYTDASYNEHRDVAACGFAVLIDGKVVKHEVTLVEGLKKVSNAEIYAVTTALQYCFLIRGVSHIIIKTDAKMIVNRFRKKKPFWELDETIETIKDCGILVDIKHVKAHSSNEINNMVDKACRNNLRKHFLSKQITWR